MTFHAPPPPPRTAPPPLPTAARPQSFRRIHPDEARPAEPFDAARYARARASSAEAPEVDPEGPTEHALAAPPVPVDAATRDVAGLPAPLEHAGAAASALAGAAGGAAMGAVAGPVGLVVGGVAGAIAGAALGHALEEEEGEVVRHDRALDDVIDVNGQGLGLPPGTPREPPAPRPPTPAIRHKV